MMLHLRAAFVFIASLALQVVAHGATVELGQGVLLDEDSGAIVAGVAQQMLVAYRLDDGQVLWRSKIAARPVLLVEDHLVAVENAARPGRLNLVTLNKRDGKQVARSTERLPPGVLASMAPDVDSRFQVRPHPKFKTSRLVWSYSPSASTQTGVRALPQSGVLRVDAATARAGALDETPPAHDKRSARLNVSFADSTDPAFFSADRTHVIVSRRLENGEGFEWSLYDRDTRLLARMDANVVYAPFVVRGDIFVSLHASAAGWRAKDSVAPVLRALDWRRGEIRWERHLSATKTR